MGEDKDKGKSVHIFTVLREFVKALALSRKAYEKTHGDRQAYACMHTHTHTRIDIRTANISMCKRNTDQDTIVPPC